MSPFERPRRKNTDGDCSFVAWMLGVFAFYLAFVAAMAAVVSLIVKGIFF